MRKTEVKDVTERKVVTVGVKCDECGKEIVGHYWYLSRSNIYPDNDIEFDLCSEECVCKKLKSYFECCKEFNSERFTLSEDFFNGSNEK